MNHEPNTLQGQTYFEALEATKGQQFTNCTFQLANLSGKDFHEALLQAIFLDAVRNFHEAVKDQQAYQAYLDALPWWHRKRLTRFLDRHPALVEAVICGLWFLAFEMALVTILCVCQILIRP